MPVHVCSEIGRLRSVLVHLPGPELLAVTPDTREDFLYDDIIDLENAQKEHRRLVAILERFTTVLSVRDLLADVVSIPAARDLLVRETLDIVPSGPLANKIEERSPEELVEMLIEGEEEEPGPLARSLNEGGYLLPPLPNLFFTRDTAMVVGDHVMIGSMRYAVRWSEELIMKLLFLHHPLLANQGILYDGAAERRHNYTLEGGDVHPLRHDTVIMGFSERSSPAAIDFLTARLFEETPITNVIVVVMPKENTAIHLDMIFTQLDRDLCAVYPPHFIGPERLPILYRKKGNETMQEMPNVFAALEHVGLPMTPVFCGGTRRSVQEREQWASGCNFVAMRPGVILSYSRNEATIAEMAKQGFRVVSSVDFLTGDERVKDGERAVITFEGSELVRAGGGPRCMTLPVHREDPWD
ncbi:MAG TPA: arginine deiminase family protein [Gemmatimonadaceae bacterium]|jgi:arginine deiminase|nr:arginine deiminase family protein [Gemmatimonadaceae bacterium]